MESLVYINQFNAERIETNKTKWEDKIDGFIIVLVRADVKLRSRELRRQIINREYEEKRRIEEQNKLRIQEEKQKIATLKAEVENWYESKKTRAYFEALKESYIKWHGSIEPGSKADEYFKWAYGYANRLDPLAPR